MATEEFTMTDKAKRDAMFQELRNSTHANERQAVKFSSNEPVLGADGKQVIFNGRPVWQSNWSVAYPAQA